MPETFVGAPPCAPLAMPKQQIENVGILALLWALATRPWVTGGSGRGSCGRAS